MTNLIKTRVCIVVASIDILGGQAIQALRLLEGLNAEPGIEAELLPINPRLPMPLRWLQRIKYLRTIVTSIAYFASLILRLPRFDVVHVFSASYFSFLLAPTPAVLISKLYGKPVLLNYHSGEAEDHLRRWPRTALPILRLADCLVVPSDYLVDVFSRFGLKADAVFNTVDQSRFQFRERRPLKPVLLSNRNLEPHYNVACVLRAFALVQSQDPEAQLVVAGDGSQRRELHGLAQGLKLSNVRFTGAVTPAEMIDLYDHAEIFVNASNIDNQPLSIIEAFASGLPVVTTSAGGIPYMVVNEATGLMVDCNDHEALARTILRLLDQPELASALVNRAHAEAKKYEWSATRSQWLTLYRDLTHAGSSNCASEGVRA